jgi:hypothetical protein
LEVAMLIIMNWSNLKENKCPECGKKLAFRLAGSKNSIRSRHGLRLKDSSDYYFCFRCDFQIKSEKLLNISSKINKEVAELVKDCKYLS